MPKLEVLPGRPPKQALETFRDALSLPAEDLTRANEWFKRNRNFIEHFDLNEVMKRAADETKLDLTEIGPLFTVVANLGLLVEEDAKLPLVAEDLRTIGLTDTQVSNFELLMEGLRFPEGRVASTTVQALQTGLPRVVDFNAVCDLRAVFEATADSSESDERVTKLIAAVPTVILTLDVRQESGRVESVVMQFSEDEFSSFQKRLGRVALQLAQLAEFNKATIL